MTDFRAVKELFEAHVAELPGGGSALAIAKGDEILLDLWAGEQSPGVPWNRQTMAPVLSAGKPALAICVILHLQRSGIDLSTRLAEYWPEFRSTDVTVAHVLAHEAGLPQIQSELDSVWDLADWGRVTRMLQELTPLWIPGSRSGYHALTWGWLLGEFVQRATGTGIEELLRGAVAGVHDGEACFAADAHQATRCAPIVGRRRIRPSQRIKSGHASLSTRAIFPAEDIIALLNSEIGLHACLPGFGGRFTARALAHTYARTTVGANGHTLADLLLSEARPLRIDVVMRRRIRWTLGFLCGGGLSREIPETVLGHGGLGSSFAALIPETGIAVAFVTSLVTDTLQPPLFGPVVSALLSQSAVSQ